MSEQAQETNSFTPTPALNKALAAVQKEMATVHAGGEGRVSGVSKSGTPYAYTYKYADLADINPMILPLLGKNGLAWVTRPTWEDGKFFLRYELRHESGQMLDGLYPLHYVGGPQDVGKEITYARRYALCAVLGIAASGDDDDGASAQQAHQQDRVLAPAQPAPAKKAARPAKPKAGDAESETAAAQRRKYHVLREQLGWDEQAGHDFIDDKSRGNATRWTDLDGRGRAYILDLMAEEIDTLNQVGAAFPAADDKPDWTPETTQD